MKCKKCGNEIPDWSYSCPNCGAKVEDDIVEHNTSTSSAGNDETTEKEIKKPNYFACDDEVEIARAKWTIIPFIIFWGIYFIALYALNVRYKNGVSVSAANVNISITNFAVMALCIISAVVCIVSIWLFLIRRELVLTNKKIYGRIGLIGTKQFVIPLKKINYISVRYSILDRILNSATIYVVPGTIFGIWFRFVANAKHFKNEIEKQIYIQY